jgi:hypothetical protein
MDLSQRELKLVLSSLYRFRGEVSGVSQSERNKLANVEKLIDKIEAETGPMKISVTSFDREIEKGLASTGLARKEKPAAPKARAKPAGAAAKKAVAASKAAPRKKASESSKAKK